MRQGKNTTQVKSDTLHIVFSADDNFSQHLGVTIASILANSIREERFHFHILDGGISKRNRSRLLSLRSIKNFQLSFLELNLDDFRNCPVSLHVTAATYYRMKMGDKLSGLNRAIYLDCDIVVNRSLTPLWNSNLKGKTVGVVEDPGREAKKASKRLECKYYFNAGVLLIDLKRWRTLQIGERCFQFLRSFPEKIVFWDQDVLNAVLRDEIVLLHPKWNLQTHIFQDGSYGYYSKDQIEEAISNPAIIHFSTDVKPWGMHCRHPHKDQYFKYLHLTPWMYPHYFKKLKAKGVMSAAVSTSWKNILRRLLRSRGLEIVHCNPDEQKELAARPELSLRELLLEKALAQRDGPINLREALFLSGLLKDLSGEGPIVEIGTLFGWSTRMMALHKDPGRELITVDNYSWNPLGLSCQEHFKLTSRILEEAISTLNVTQERMGKDEFYSSYTGVAPALFFADAIHSYEETKADILWAKEAGTQIICGHDYDERFPGVIEAVNEFGGPRKLVGTLWVL